MSKVNKILVIFLSLFLGLNTQLSSNSQQDHKKNANPKKAEASHSDYNKLQKDPDWIKLAAYWKILNALPDEANGQQRFKLFEPIMKAQDKVSAYINGLFNKKLINATERDFLLTTIEQRYHYLSFKVGTTKCYDMSELGYKIVLKRDDLEKRYEALEKLFKENKINSEAYKQAKDKIIEDFKFIEVNDYQKPDKDINVNLIDLLINLNR